MEGVTLLWDGLDAQSCFDFDDRYAIALSLSNTCIVIMLLLWTNVYGSSNKRSYYMSKYSTHVKIIFVLGISQYASN